MRASLRLFLSVLLFGVVLSGCAPAEAMATELPTRTVEVVSSPSSTFPASATATATETETATSTSTPTVAPTQTFPPDMECGEFFCQQPWRGVLERPFAEDKVRTIDPTYPYASTKNNTLDPHHGVEFPNGYGTSVLAAQSGTVVFAGSDELTLIGPYTSFYGNAVILYHPSLSEGHDLYTLYGHLSEITVAEGDEVSHGDVIGKVGASGAAVGSHLHFEVRLDENSYAATTNPMLWFAPVTDPWEGVTSTLAGLIVDRYGAPLDRFDLSLEKLDANGAVAATYYPVTYYPAGVNGNPALSENFVMPDLPPGDYRLVFIYGSFYEYYFTLAPDSLGFIDLQLD